MDELILVLDNLIVSGIKYAKTSIAISENVGIVAGGSSTFGRFFKTTDGGATWVESQSPVSQAINGLFFINENLGFAVANGHILKTTNGTLSWSVYNVFAVDGLTSIKFFTNDIGIVGASNRFYRTTDGGDSWVSVDKVISGSILDITTVGTTAYAISTDGKVAKSIDSGLTWTEIYTAPRKLTKIQFLDANNGFIAGGTGFDNSLGQLLQKTTDGGTTWTTIFDNIIYNDISSIFFKDVNFGYYSSRTLDGGGLVIEAQSGLFRTTDAGLTWEKVDAAIHNGFTSISFANKVAYLASPDSAYRLEILQFSIELIKTDIICNGSETGSITTNIIGGAGDAIYEFLWQDGVTTQNRINVPADVYTVIINDQYDNIQEATITITQPTVITVLANVTGRDVTLTVSGGTPGYTYLWSDGSTDKNRLDLAPDNYTVTVTDAAGCTKQANIVIEDYRFFFTKNPIDLSLQAISLETKPNLSFVCEVWIEPEYQSNVFEKIIETEQPADLQGKTNFQVEEIIDAYMQSQLPIFADNQTRLVTNAFKRFYLKYSEKFGTPPELSSFSQVDTLFAIHGGLSDEEHAADTFFNSYLQDVKPFLTWEPTTKTVTETQHEYLHYVVSVAGLSALRMRVRVFYDDGTDFETNRADHLIADPVQFEVYRFPCGLEQLDLNQYDPTKTIIKYEIFLNDLASVQISETRTYNVTEHHQSTRTFLYTNSMGGWNTLAATGKSKGQLKTREESIQKPLPVKYSVSDSEFEVISKTGELTYQIEAGYRKNSEMMHLIDFAISKKVYEITSNRYIPVQVEANMNIFDDFENHQEFKFTIYPPQVKAYTPQL